MKVRDQFDHLAGVVKDLVSRYDREAKRHKRTALIVRMCSVLVAATITILLGFHYGNDVTPTWASNSALVLGSLITVLSAYDAFFDPRVLWVRETITFARLKDLDRDICYWGARQAFTDGPDGQDPASARDVDAFKARLDGILQDTLRHWIKMKGAVDVESSSSLLSGAEPAHGTSPADPDRAVQT